MTDFDGLDLIEPIRRAVAAEGYTAPTPIQAGAIPSLLEGRDLLGIAQTGTGKTAAFVLPLLNTLSKSVATPSPRGKGYPPRALILAPTRELAGQINDSIRAYGRHLGLRSTVVFGGVPINRQIRALASGVDIVTATPGRLLDLINQRKVELDRVSVFVLDEADRMLDIGFIHDIRKIAARLPKRRQTVLFSATMPGSVQALADSLLNEPVRVEVAPQATTAERISQRVLFVAPTNKRDLLRDLMADEKLARVLVFTRTKHGADKVAKQLGQDGVKAEAIHGNKSQNARQKALDEFKGGRVRALVATDIAARGIDVDGVTHVVNFDLPNDPESYVHRIGRTARAGAEGMAISFCAPDEHAQLRGIEKVIRQSVPVVSDHPYHDPTPTKAANAKKTFGKSWRGNSSGGRNNGNGNGQGRGPRRRAA